jgi:hypothetical protein
LNGRTTLRVKIDPAVSNSSEPGASASRKPVPASSPTIHAG